MKPIDIHTHVFNIRYLPLSGIIRRYTNNIISLRIAKGVARYLLRHTGSSFEQEQFLPFSAHGKVTIVELMGGSLKQPTIQQKALDSRYSLFSMTPDEMIAELQDLFNANDILDKEVRQALEEFAPQQKMQIQGAFRATSSFMKDSNTLLFRPDMLGFIPGVMGDMLETVFNAMESGYNHLRWLIFMMNSEEDIFIHLSEKDEKGVSTYVHHMMDVDHYFKEIKGTEHKSYYDFGTTQIRNMQMLQAKHPNLIGFVAVDPSKPNWQEIMDRAIEAGFKGIKIYPPMGYHYDVHDDMLANRIYAILEYCVERDLPLFAHCNNGGFEAYPGKRHSGYNSNPVYWARALQRFPALRLCLGHAGGGSGWFSEHSSGDVMKAEDISVSWVRDDSESQKKWNNSYAAQVFRLCVLYPNVYCDASYLDELVDASGGLSEDQSKDFRERLLILFKNNPDFQKKIMYGSDWHMLFREAKNATYYKTYVKFFEHPDLSTHREAFFEANARGYLQLT